MVWNSLAFMLLNQSEPFGMGLALILGMYVLVSWYMSSNPVFSSWFWTLLGGPGFGGDPTGRKEIERIVVRDCPGIDPR